MQVTEKIKITNEDNMTLMARYPDNYFDLAIVDPPYGINMAQTINIANKKKGFNGKKHHKKKDWDKTTPQKKYFDELKRVSKNQIIWGGNYFTEHLKPTKSWIFWSKKETKTQGSNFSDGELAWTSTKKLTRLFEYGWIGIDYCNKNEVKQHPTQKPVRLYEWLLMNYGKENDKILDTHLGSGSIAIACHNLGFELTACELDKDYYNDSIKRIKQHISQLRIF
tara:strand:+ start:688 stop:1356 length:669 start_codon:yes stop_codon:yes gene_type:complete